MIVLVYLIIPALVLVLWFAARNEKVPEAGNGERLSTELYRVSLFIYKHTFRKKGAAASQKVRGYLKVLNNSGDMETMVADYYAHKISVALLLFVCGSILAMLLHFSGAADQELQDGAVARAQPGYGEKEYSLVAMDESGESLGQFQIVVDEKLYTEKEAQSLFEEASALMEERILLENESLDNVNSNLNLVEKLDGYPFSISWTTDNIDMVSYKGEIDWEQVPEEGCIVTLEATYKYQKSKWQQVLYARLIPKQLSAAEALEKGLRDLIEREKENSQYEETVHLPAEYEGMQVTWRENGEDNSIVLLLLMVIGGAASFILKDNELKKKIEDRDEELKREYPQFVSQLVLYLGAGMTMRNVFAKLSDNYVSKRKNGAKPNLLYEEVLRTTRELSSGKSESEAYTDFGYRCRGQQFTRLSTLLTQNLRKGNSELLTLLKEESQRAFEDRLDQVRKKGEEAGTKLLLPMTLMLLIVMVVIMIPAYMQF